MIFLKPSEGYHFYLYSTTTLSKHWSYFKLETIQPDLHPRAGGGEERVRLNKRQRNVEEREVERKRKRDRLRETGRDRKTERQKREGNKEREEREL